MVLIKTIKTDVGEEISREIEYQRLRGYVATYIEMSPEAHEAMRLRVKAPSNSVLTEHDGLPVSVNIKMMGLRGWRVHYTVPAPPTERMMDRVRAG